MKRYYSNTKMTPYLATVIAQGFCEGVEANKDEEHDAWQYLVDTDLAWYLESIFGQVAKSLIKAGLIQPKERRKNDRNNEKIWNKSNAKDTREIDSDNHRISDISSVQHSIENKLDTEEGAYIQFGGQSGRQ